MDIVRIPGSRIVDVARLAFATPGTDFLCFGESDRPSPGCARDALVAALDAGMTKYPPVRGLPPLRAALAGYLSDLHGRPGGRPGGWAVADDRIQITASGMAAVSVALAACVRAGERVVIHTPLWPNIANAITLRGAVVDEIALSARADGGFLLDLDRLAAKLRGARAFVLNSPNNPTGWTATPAEIQVILDICRREKVWLIADDVYSRLVYDGADAAPSVLDIATPDDRVMVCNSFSKTWVMTGWRLGWVVVPQGTGDAVAEIVEVTHSGTAPFIQQAGLAAVADRDVVADFRAVCAAGRRLCGDALGGLNGVRYAAPEGAFYAFVGIAGLRDSLGLAKRLITDHGVAVAPGVAFGAAGEGHLRICFAQSPALIERAMGRLRDGLRAVGSIG